MIAQFSVENYLSIKNKAVLNLTANRADKEHPENVYPYEKLSCLRSAVVYGANASGKSNLLKAMTAAIMMVRESQILQVNDPLIRIIPFAFSSETVNKPTAFEFVFFVGDERYIYGFSATSREIKDEYLYVYLSAKKSMVFERSDTDHYKFNKVDEKEFNSYKEKTGRNKLFLAVATAWNCEKTRPAFLWFAEKVETYTDDSFEQKMGDSLHRMKESESPELTSFTLQLLKNADINIDSYSIKADSFRTMPDEIKNMIAGDLRNVLEQNLPVYSAFTGHTMPDGSKFVLGLNNESLGTQNLFSLSPLLYETLIQGKSLFIDEMSSLHTSLVQYLVSIFHNNEINKKNAQLIFATHDTNQLNLRLFRRDQIYFIEKDEYGASDLYPLDSFPVRKTDNIEVAYLIGRYGAIPVLGGAALL